MKLVPTMFYDPEPKPEDFNKVCGFPCKCRDCADVPDSKCGYKLHEAAHNEWKRRQIKPTRRKNGLRYGFKYYNEHRLRFKGFTRTEDTDVIELTNGRLTITFEDGGPGVGVYYANPNMCVLNLYYANGLSLKLFNDTIKENGINLQEI